MMHKSHCAAHRFLGVAVCLVYTALSLQAQTVGTLRDTLDYAVVTARSLRSAPSSAIATQTMDTATFQRLGITGMSDALRRMAGVNLRDYGGAGGLKTVSVRGLGAAHTVVAYDGLALSDVRQGQIDLGRFSPDRLQGMALHIGGQEELLCPVRNLGAATLTLTSLQPTFDRKGLHGYAALRQASFSTYNPSLSLAHSLGKRAGVSAAADFYYGLNNYPFTVQNGVATHRERRTNSKMQAWTGELNFCGTTHGGGTWSAKAYYYNNRRQLPGQVILYTNENHERLDEQTAFVQTRWAQKWERVEAYVAAKYNWQESKYADLDEQYPGGALRQHYWQQEAYATAGVAGRVAGVEWAYAADYAFTALESNLVSDQEPVRHSLLQSLSLRYRHRRLNATARLVADLHREKTTEPRAEATITHHFSPEASLAILLADHRGAEGRRVAAHARLGYKEMFRMPTFTEAYFYHLGEQNLQPEKTRQLNLGLALQARPAAWCTSLSFTADAYANRVTDRISAVPYNLFVWRTVNMGKVYIYGLDMTLQSHCNVAQGHSLILHTNYSMQHAQDRTARGSVGYGKQPAYMPRHSGGASLAYENPWVNFVVRLTYCTERWSTNEHLATTRLPGYVEVGAGVYKQWQLAGLSWEARADLLNAFDRQYEIVRRYPMPGRAYKLSLKVSF